MIRLSRTVSLKSVDIEATIAAGRQRPEFLAVARLAADLGRINGADISRELLGNLPEQVGWRVLDRAVELKLLEQREGRGPASLSEAGRTMLEGGFVLTPEEGVWRLFWIDDPLILSPMTHAVRIEVESAMDTRKALKKGGRAKQGHACPGIPKSRREIWRSIVNGKSYQIRGLAGQGGVVSISKLELPLLWSPDGEPQLSLQGAFPAGSPDQKETPLDVAVPVPSSLAALTYQELWTRLIAGATSWTEHELKSWERRAGEPVLPVDPEGLESAERLSFSKGVELPAMSMPDLGSFSKTKLDDVRLVPESKAAADWWARDLLLNGIRDYAVPTTLEATREDVRRRFTLFRPELPTIDEILQSALKNPLDHKSKFVLAPYDLGLWSDQ